MTPDRVLPQQSLPLTGPDHREKPTAAVAGARFGGLLAAKALRTANLFRDRVARVITSGPGRSTTAQPDNVLGESEDGGRSDSKPP